VVGRVYYLLKTNAHVAVSLELLQRKRDRDEKAFATLQKENALLTEDVRKLQELLAESAHTVASLSAIKAQAQNQQNEYLRLMDENINLMKLVEKLDAQV